jgi:hypothetical protein
MLRSAVLRYAGLVVIALTMAIAAGPAMAQVTPAPSTSPTIPPADRPAAPADRPASVDKTTTGMVEGSVKKVDPGANQVQVSSGLFGILGKTLEVTSDTQIQMEGRQATLADLREGSKVKASYETRDGKNVARRIEVMPAQEADKGTTGRTPGKGY